MNRSGADILWEVACVLARDAGDVSRAAGRRITALPPLLFFTDPARTPRPWETAARLPPGSGVVYRAFDAPDARETGLRLRETTRERGLLLLVGLDADLAGAVEADGVHLPERALARAQALQAGHPDWLITGAVHSPEGLVAPAGLDAAVLSPVFAPGGASSARPPLGLARFSDLARAAGIPVYALGGVHGGNARTLIGTGACGLAAVSAIQAAFGPDES